MCAVNLLILSLNHLYILGNWFNQMFISSNN